jgi:hypothetical protein
VKSAPEIAACLVVIGFNIQQVGLPLKRYRNVKFYLLYREDNVDDLFAIAVV